MQYKFLTIPYHNPEDSVAELNRFLAGHRILTVDRQFLPDGSNSAWALCVAFDSGAAGVTTRRTATTTWAFAASELRGGLDEPALNRFVTRAFAGPSGTHQNWTKAGVLVGCRMTPRRLADPNKASRFSRSVQGCVVGRHLSSRTMVTSRVWACAGAARRLSATASLGRGGERPPTRRDPAAMSG